MPHLLEILRARGMLHDATPGLAERLASGPITGYVGFDPTADSLHVGNLIPVMALAWLQRSGGRPIVLVGGGTGLIGDPSGRRTERRLLDPEMVLANAARIQEQLSRFLAFGNGPSDAFLRNNTDWLGSISLLDFLRDTGKHFTVNYMLQKESVRSRMDDGISFTEFSYMLIQAFDFAHLAQHDDCELQLGGSDQWGNITAGIELAARRDRRALHGAVVPLLTTASGSKFGKSEDGNVWLDAARTSPYAFHQFWLRTEDADVERLLRFFTFIELDEIREIAEAHTRQPERRIAQRRLADEVTAQVHGTDAVRRAESAARILFGTADVRDADRATLEMIAREIPVRAIARDELERGIALVALLEMSGLASSKSDARRGLAQGGFSVNGVAASGDEAITTDHLLLGEWILLRKGKKHWAAVVAA